MHLRAPITLTDPPTFFLQPHHPKQRQYEALRAYYVEGRSSQQAARAFGYSPGAFRVLCHSFLRDPNPCFFISSRTGPRSQPKKSAARSLVIALRKQNHSVYEISQALKERKLPLSPTAVREVLKAEGFAALPRRLDEERPQRPQPTVEPVADVRAFSLAPRKFFTRCGGLFLFLPELARLDPGQLAQAARLPGSKMIPPAHALRACLALKLWSIERKSHVMALVADEGLALFSGLNARSRSQPGMLVFLAQDERSQTFCYANADLRKGEEAQEIFQFIDFWEKAHGQRPRHLVFDSKLTTQANLARLDRMKIDFITLRRRSPALLREVYGLPRSAWRTIELDVPSRQYQTPRVYEQPVTLCGRRFRQLFVLDLGHDKPTILLTNQSGGAAKLITRYARRMLIENSLSDAVRFFHMNALSSAVGLKVDFDMALLVIASGLYRLLARQMRGYADAQARQIFRDLLDLPAQVEITEQEVRVEFHRRAHLPIVLASGLCNKSIAIPWWPKRRLRLTTYTGR